MEKAQKAHLGFSWADEVEREEREEGQKEATQALVVDERSSKKPNPFGAARPREVVLEEKRVDWRKLDCDLDHSSILRKEKKLKENIPTANSLVNRHEHCPLGQRYSVQSNTQNPGVPHQTMAHYVHPEQQKQDIINALVPPLRYPPKNINALMKEIRKCHRTNRLDPDQEKFHQDKYPCKFIVEREREHMKHRRTEMRLLAHELMGPVEVLVQNATTRAYLYPNVERGHVRISPEFDTRITGKDVEFGCDRRKFLGERFVDSIEEMRPIGRRQVLADLNIYEGSYQGGGRTRKYVQDLMDPPRGPHGWAYSYQSCSIERGNFGDQFKDRGLRLANGVMSEYGRRNNEGELVGHSRRAVTDRERAREDQHKLNKDVKVTAVNQKKKRGMPSEVNPVPSCKRRQRKHSRK